jgi:hypothetical protein
MSASPWFNKDAFGGMSGITEDPFSQNQEQSASLEFLIPPKRILPFSSTPIPPPQSSLLKKPIPKPKSQPGASTPTHKPTKKRVVSRKPPPVMKAMAPPREGLSPTANKVATLAGPSLETPVLQSLADPVKKRITAPIRPPSASKRSKMVDGATQTQTVSGRDHTALHKEPDLIAAEVPTPPSPESPPEHYLKALDKFVAQYKKRAAPRELWKSPGYEEGTEEERHLMLNDYICDNLNDPGFLQICEDVESSWQRIGLGM